MLGVGAAVLTRDTAKKVVNEMVKQGKLSKKEGDRLVSSMMDESAKQRKNVEKLVKKHTKKAVKTVGPATRKELTKLSKRIAELERMVSAPAKKKAVKKKARKVSKKKPVKKKVARKKPVKRKPSTKKRAKKR